MLKQFSKSFFSTAINTVAIGGLVLASSTAVADGGSVYRVTITNVTNSINFTPILVSSHRRGVSLFELGAPASDSLAAVAEAGDTSGLAADLNGNPRVAQVTSTAGLLGPGESVSVEVSARHGARRISLASMMLPTNDGFIALNGVKAPRNGTATYVIPGYDAGSEPNDELCLNIPGPTCMGEGPSPLVDGEGYVHINRGIHGIGNLAADVYDWRNPVAVVKVTRVHGHD